MSSIAQKVAQTVSSRDAATQRETFIDCLRYLALGKLDGSPDAAARLAQAAGRAKASAILESDSFRTVKSAVAPGTTIDGTWAAPLSYVGAAQAWVNSLSNSAFDALLAGGATVAPIQSRVGIVSLGAIGSAPGEGSLKVIGSLSLASDTLPPRKAAAVVVVTSELLKMSGTVGSALIDQELRTAIIKTVDSEFLRVISDGATSTASQGSSSEALRLDIKAALARMTGTHAGSRLYAIVNSRTFKEWITMPLTADSGPPAGLFVPMGGPAGMGAIKVLVSEGVGFGVWYLVDASGIAAGSEGVTIDASSVATLHVDDAPDSPPTASTIFRSMFSSNCVAIKCERYFSAVRMRSDSVQTISGVDYSSSPP